MTESNCVDKDSHDKLSLSRRLFGADLGELACRAGSPRYYLVVCLSLQGFYEDLYLISQRLQVDFNLLGCGVVVSENLTDTR